ncbi:hypothetical protein A2Y85_06200 [candidate division WOR-3 bacterium RBG_13_43_14]|uniref:Transposase IS200-like domain-containing protein n=1 Tax=candidate division WOR-3 bacterium RBG_13_43_14 TaxID=1802590 RepID=A0A1F4UF30_UNCW3|nr:MAG: hypothetical protein A2Y85_06200 [candidate division WOR-3 bacterium RBG_13_43_14]
MVWKPRLRGENLYHHIYAWGNDHHPVLKEHMHYEEYLRLLEQFTCDYSIEVIAYALMKTHVHLFIYDIYNNISMFMQKLHGEYAQYYNRSTQRIGHVFGERYNNKIVLTNLYGKWLSRYIHRQAVEAKLVNDPQQHKWTSYHAYIGKKKIKFLKPEIILSQFGAPSEQFKYYRQFVLNEENGPVDWENPKLKIINTSMIIDHLCEELKINRKNLLDPHGYTERKQRHEAVKLLVNEYGLKRYEICNIFGLSYRMTLKILCN